MTTGAVRVLPFSAYFLAERLVETLSSDVHAVSGRDDGAGQMIIWGLSFVFRSHRALTASPAGVKMKFHFTARSSGRHRRLEGCEPGPTFRMRVGDCDNRISVARNISVADTASPTVPVPHRARPRAQRPQAPQPRRGTSRSSATTASRRSRRRSCPASPPPGALAESLAASPAPLPPLRRPGRRRRRAARTTALRTTCPPREAARRCGIAIPRSS